MIYVFVDVDFYEYNGLEVFVGPKMDEKKLYSLIKKYYKEFEIIFQNIYDYFVEKYKMEIYAESEKDMSCVHYDSEYYIDCEVHAMLEYIIGFSNDQHSFWGEYCNMYINKMLHKNHGFEQNPETNISIKSLGYGCCC